MKKKKKLAILVYNDIEILDFAGPYEVFSIANELMERKLFDLFLISEKLFNIEGRNRFRFKVDYNFENYPKFDYLVIPGGPGSRIEEKNKSIIEWIESEFLRIENLLTICTGARILANTKILKNEKITTHWNSINYLKKNKKLNVIENVKFTDNGKILTSAGVSSGIDLCLYFIKKKYGNDLYEDLKKYIEWN